MPPAIELRKASAGYPGHAVLRDIDLAISGGRARRRDGPLRRRQDDVAQPALRAAAERVALIPQAAALVKPLLGVPQRLYGPARPCSTWHNLRTLAWPARRDVDEIERVLGLVDLADKLFVKAGKLSGGQQQRASVARALYNGRPILIGDEPVSALDRVQGAAVWPGCASVTRPRSSPCTTSRSP